MQKSLKTNFHTHTQFCDGRSDARQMALTAGSKDFDLLGFSSHAMYPYAIDDSYIAYEHFDEYSSTIDNIKQNYEKLFNIKTQFFKGFEADFIEDHTMPTFAQYKRFNPDFLIGAVHFINVDDNFFAVDKSSDELLKAIDDLFNGNVKKCVQRYFELERIMLEKCDFDILAHCDLINKYNKKIKLFDTNDEWYKSEIKALVQSIKKNGCIVEINTGGLARGYDVIYPNEYCLELLKENNIPITISSDAHDAINLDFGFDKAVALAKKIGYSEKAIPYNGSIEFFEL